jgi:hypothetical protein
MHVVAYACVKQKHSARLIFVKEVWVRFGCTLSACACCSFQDKAPAHNAHRPMQRQYSLRDCKKHDALGGRFSPLG